MGLPSDLDDHAWACHGKGGKPDHPQTAARLRRSPRRWGLPGGLTLLLLTLLTCFAAQAETLRVATFNTELSRDGPGLLLRDIQRGTDPQILRLIDTLVRIRPDIVVLQGFDYDLGGAAITALKETLRKEGLHLDHHFAPAPNSGLRTPLDLDGDGRPGGPGDAQGYGRFFGQGGIAVISRFPINEANIQDFSTFLWRDLPGALLPQVAGKPFPSAEAQAIQRLHSHGAWVVPLVLSEGQIIELLLYHASPPVFDGPEDRNGRRNHDETRFWTLFLNGQIGTPPKVPLILLADANLDPHRGAGRGEAMRDLLAHPRLQDPLPGRPTVAWPQTGPMRVDYLLPSRHWRVLKAGITPLHKGGSRHGLVWADLILLP